ncbi:hypothetical protein E0485_20760 [Paenibacillus albiflavus]|uniref:Spore coat assembly protein n=1 Tax=Paenibacillus albiflavus TaxID=2545760 RepID=A0A4V2WMZ5_9BACL|nr:CotH kinase family protein [Paenibacillus albiflavus]TCZ73542.1 hypothetical protein E0485_20760 [Paenibacillus albiflavus]
MKNKYVLVVFALLIFLFITIMFMLPRIGVEPVKLDHTYEEQIFDQSRVTSVDITLDDKDLKSIFANPLDEAMVPADVTINGKKVQGVGLRVKGNMTLTSVAQMSDSDRYSFKIDFDYYQDDLNLYGLKKLNLNNNYTDPSQMREYLSYALMESMGVPTPANSYMYVTINGEEWGLYLGVEAIEEPFLAQHYVSGTGDLYKPDGTGSDLKWISDDIKDYSGMNLKTNKGVSDQSAIIAMLDAINNGGDIEKVLDVDEILRYFAANTALVNLDSYQGNLKHNYYLYEENGVFSILPWDYNMSFGGFSGMGGMGGFGGMMDAADGIGDKLPAEQNNKQVEQNNKQAEPNNQQVQPNNKQAGNNRNRGMMGGNPGGDMAANFLSETNINFSITTPVSGISLEDRPLLNSLLSVPEYREKFNSYLDEIANNFFSEDQMSAKTKQISDLISSYIDKDPTKFYTKEQFDESVSGDKSLVEFAIQRAESIKKQLSGELVVEATTTGGPRGELGGQNANGDKQGQGQFQPPNFGNGQDPGQMQPPNFGDGQDLGQMQPPNLGDGQDLGQMQPPNFVDGQDRGQMQPPNFGDGQDLGQMQPPNLGDGRNPGGMQRPGNNASSTASGEYTWQSVAITSAFILLLVGSTIFGLKYQRRRYSK